MKRHARHTAGIVVSNLLAELGHSHGRSLGQHVVSPGNGRLTGLLGATMHGFVKPLGVHLPVPAEIDPPVPSTRSGLVVFDGVHPM